MASKTIHICDRCRSYIEDITEVFPLQIIITWPRLMPHARRLALSSKIAAAKNIGRIICLECAEAITEEYLLMIEDTSPELFKDFKPPTAQDNLQKKIDAYHDE